MTPAVGSAAVRGRIFPPMTLAAARDARAPAGSTAVRGRTP